MSLLTRLFRRKPRTWRAPQLAGHLYPISAEALTALLDAPGEAPRAQPKGTLKALVVPFAELGFMHPIAQPAWALARDAGADWTRVVLMAPALRLPFGGLATPSWEAFRSPLGDAWLDRVILDELAEQSEAARCHDPAHEVEATLEVLVPYAQHFLTGVPLAPILVGDGAERAAQGFIDIMAQQPGTLLVIATELSCELPDAQARALDADTAAKIEALDADSITRERASSKQTLAALLRVAAQRGWTAHTLALGTSAAASGDRGAVVGYGAFALVEP